MRKYVVSSDARKSVLASQSPASLVTTDGLRADTVSRSQASEVPYEVRIEHILACKSSWYRSILRHRRALTSLAVHQHNTAASAAKTHVLYSRSRHFTDVASSMASRVPPPTNDQTCERLNRRFSSYGLTHNVYGVPIDRVHLPKADAPQQS